MKWLMPYCIHNKHSSVCHLASHYNCDTLYVQKVDIFIVVRSLFLLKYFWKTVKKLAYFAKTQTIGKQACYVQ